MITEIFINVFQFAFYSVVLAAIIYFAVVSAIRNSFIHLISEFLPIYLDMLQQASEEQNGKEEIYDALESDEISTTQAVDMLRKMRGEKD